MSSICALPQALNLLKRSSQATDLSSQLNVERDVKESNLGFLLCNGLRELQMCTKSIKRSSFFFFFGSLWFPCVKECFPFVLSSVEPWNRSTAGSMHIQGTNYGSIAGKLSHHLASTSFEILDGMWSNLWRVSNSRLSKPGKDAHWARKYANVCFERGSLKPCFSVKHLSKTWNHWPSFAPECTQVIQSALNTSR